MNTIGRLVIGDRGDENSPKLVLGVIFASAKIQSLKTDTVYEIVDFMGELTLQKVGRSAIKQTMDDPENKIDVCWSNDINRIACDGDYLLTQKEACDRAKLMETENDA
jgi:hypothetical protein